MKLLFIVTFRCQVSKFVLTKLFFLPRYLKAQCIGIIIQYLQRRLFSAIPSETGGGSQGKDIDVPCRHFSSKPSFKEVPVFSTLAPAATSEIDKGLTPLRKGPASSHLSRGLMLVNGYPNMNARWQWAGTRGMLEPGDFKGLVL